MANYFTQGNIRRSRLRTLFFLLMLVVSSSLLGQGFQIYLVEAQPDLRESTDCHYCFELTEKSLFETPLLEQSDIEFFDWDNQTIKVKNEGQEKINRLKIPLHGRAAAIVMDGKPIYGFWFWNVVSSFGCDRVYTYPTLNFKLEFGLPTGYANGQDPRFDGRIKDGLIKGHLMK